MDFVENNSVEEFTMEDSLRRRDRCQVDLTQRRIEDASVAIVRVFCLHFTLSLCNDKTNEPRADYSPILAATRQPLSRAIANSVAKRSGLVPARSGSCKICLAPAASFVGRLFRIVPSLFFLVEYFWKTVSSFSLPLLYSSFSFRYTFLHRSAYLWGKISNRFGRLKVHKSTRPSFRTHVEEIDRTLSSIFFRILSITMRIRIRVRIQRIDGWSFREKAYIERKRLWFLGYYLLYFLGEFLLDSEIPVVFGPWLL